jgi:hypothetical protein
MVLAPDDGVAVLSFTDSATVTPDRVADALLRDLLGAGADVPRLDVPERPEVWDELVRLVRPGAGHPHQRAAAGAHWRRRGSADPRQAPDVAPYTPMPRLRRAHRLHADDPADPYLFRLDLTDEGLGTWPVAFSRDGARGTCMHMGVTPISLYRRPGYRSPARLAAAGAGAAGVAGAGAAGVAGAAAAWRAIGRRTAS